MDRSLFRPFACHAPFALSFFSLTLCLIGWSGLLQDPRQDEGALAHLYQLSMIGEVPIILLFLAYALERGLRKDLPILAAQCGSWIVALLAVPVLHL